MDSRYDFNNCTSYEEFEKAYNSLCTSLEGRLINDKLQEYIDQRFPNKELIISARGNRARLQKLFESGNISIDGICDEMQRISNEQEEVKDDTTIVTDKPDETILEEKSSLGRTQTVEQGTETNEKFRINEYGEIVISKNNKNNVIVMSMEEYNKKNMKKDIIKKLKKSEDEIEKGEGIESDTAFKELRQKYGY